MCACAHLESKLETDNKFASPWARACQIRWMLGKWYWSLDAGRLLIGKWTAREAALGTFPDKVYPLFPPGDPLKSQNQQKLVQKRAPKKNHFWTNFGAHFGPKMAPKMGPKLVQKLTIFGFIFGSLVFEVLELFGCLLGAFMGLWSLSWEAPGPQKP